MFKLKLSLYILILLALNTYVFAESTADKTPSIESEIQAELNTINNQASNNLQNKPLNENTSHSYILPQCQELLLSCFNKTKAQKINCFFTSSQHAFCQGTSLSKLALKRWEFSPDVGNNKKIDARAKINPNALLANQECLEGFDATWLSSLMTEANTEEGISNLSTKLDACRVKLLDEVVNP